MTKAETLEKVKYLNRKDNPYGIISEWLIEERATYPKYPYLDELVKYVIKRNGLQLDKMEEDNLKTLLYNASHEAHIRKKAAQGWIKGTEENLSPYNGKIVEMLSEGIFGDAAIKMKAYKAPDDIWYFMKPRARTRGISAIYKEFRPI